MSAVRLPIELQIINAKLAKTMAVLQASVKQLDSSFDVLNKSINNVGGNKVSKSLKVIQKQMEATSKTIEENSKSVVASFALFSAAALSASEALGFILRRFFNTDAAQVFSKTIRASGASLFFLSERLADTSENVFQFVRSLGRINLPNLKRIAASGIIIPMQLSTKALRLFSEQLFILSRVTSPRIDSRFFQALSKGADAASASISRFDSSLRFSLIRARAFSAFTPIFDKSTKSVLLFENIAVKASNALTKLSTFGVTASSTIDQFGRKVFDATRANTGFFAALRGNVLSAFGKNTENVTGNFRKYSKEIFGAAKETELFQKGLFATIAKIKVLGLGFTLLGDSLRKSESGFVRFIGTVTLLIGAVLDPLGIVLTRVITKVGQLSFALGSTIVDANLKAAQSFFNAELKAFTFQRTMKNFSEEFPSVISGVNDFDDVMQRLNETTGESRSNLQFIVTELVTATSGIGVTKKQMELLTSASVDFAAQIKGDSTQAVIDLISAINGNSQSVLKYGVHLSAAAVQQKLLDLGIRKTFSTMTEQEKVQARLTVLTKQYGLIQGIAAKQVETTEGAAKKLSGKMKQLTQDFGKGAAVIEDVALQQKILIGTIDNLNPLVVKTAGFFSALIGRILQVGGALLQFSFTLIVVTTSYKALNVLLASEAFGRVFLATIPKINLSLASMAATAAGTSVSITSVGTAFKFMAATVIFQSKRVLAAFIGIEVASLTMGTFFIGIMAKMRVAFLFFARTVLLNPVVLAITAIVGSLILLFNALKKIEVATKAFSNTFGAIASIFDSTNKELQRTVASVEEVDSTFDVLFNETIGLGVLAVIGNLQIVVNVLSLIEGAFGNVEKVAKLDKSSREISKVTQLLFDAGFNLDRFAKLYKEKMRKISSTKDPKPAALEVLPEKFQRLQAQLDAIGATEIEKARQTRDRRLAIVAEGLTKLKLSEEQASQLRINILNAFAKQSEGIERKRIENLAQISASVGGAAGLKAQADARILELREAKTAELLTELEFDQAKRQIELDAAARSLETKLNFISDTADIENGSRIDTLKAQQVFLQNQLNLENLNNAQRIAAEKKSAEIRGVIREKERRDQQKTLSLFSSFARSEQSTQKAIGKAAALTQIAIDTEAAVSSAFAFGTRIGGPPLGFVFGGIAAAAQAVRADNVTRLATGITAVPPGFNNDTFPARLSSGERVLSVPQNRDLTEFLEGKPKTESKPSEALKEMLENLNQAILVLGSRIEDQDGEIVVNIGNREIFRSLRSGLREGRSLAI